MADKKIPKIVFSDANVFINCALQEAKGSDCEVLEKILKKIKGGEIILVLPEITKNETFKRLDSKIKKLKQGMAKAFSPMDNYVKKLKEEERGSKIVEKTMEDGIKKLNEKF